MLRWTTLPNTCDAFAPRYPCLAVVCQGDVQLSDNAREAISEAANTKYVSVASIWEVAIKTAIGKMTWHEPFQDFIDRELKRFRILSIHAEHAVGTLSLPLHHRDPFDRMLAAQALRRRLTVISRDAVFDKYGVQRLW
jgi:PIN domain nuclease of toxin-antitoxin system